MSKPILFGAGEVDFAGNGLGRLSDAISCVVEEKINGKYELEMVYPIDGIHFSDLAEHRYLYCPHDETGFYQPFEIYRISRPINGKVTVCAAHISYKLNKMLVKPFTADTVGTALSNFTSKAIDSMPFTFISDKTNSGSMNIEVPVAIKSAMGGMEGSMLDVYGGEWEYDHWQCILRSRRGDDNGVNIRYGKNLTDVTKVSDSTNLWTGIVPYWRGTDPDINAEEIIVYNGIIYSNAHDNYAYPMNIAVDASSYFDSPPTQSQLQSWGQSYVNSNARAGIPSTINISFVQLWQTEEYKNVAPLQRLSLGDTLDIFYEKLGVNNTARVVAYKYNVLLDRYDSMTVGEVKATLASTIQKGIDEVVKELPSKSFFERALDRATKLITGGYGGHVVINTNEAGQPNEILIMDTDDITTAVNVIRMNMGGIGFSRNGYNPGSFVTAWTIDGTFDAQQINVVNLTASAIRGGILKLGGIDNGNGVLQVYDATGTNLIGSITKDGASLTGTITMRNGNALSTVGPISVPQLASDNSIEWVDVTGLKVEYDTGSTYENFYAAVAKSNVTREYAVSLGNYFKSFLVDAGSSSRILYSLAFRTTGITLEHASSGGYGYFSLSQNVIDCCANSRNTYPQILLQSDNSSNHNIIIQTSANRYIHLGNIIDIRASSNCYIDIGDNGDIKFRGGSNNYINVTSGYFTWNGVQIASASTSSKRYKHDIKTMQDDEFNPHRLLKLQVKQFVYNDDAPLQYKDTKGKTIPGFIAEEVNEIYPSAVIHHPETGEIESWDERRIIPPMLSLIQEQYAKIEVLEERINKLEILLEEVLKK